MILWQVIFWAVVAIGLIVVELVSAQLVSIWFGLSACIVFCLAFNITNFTTQLVIFGVISAILLFATRPISKKLMENKSVSTNADALIGCECVVQTEVSNAIGGRVLVNGKDWSARIETSNHDEKLAEGQKCIIKEIKGVTLIVHAIAVNAID